MPIGFQPTQDTLILSLHADFIHTMTAPADTPYPSGFDAKIEIVSKAGTVIATWASVTHTTTAVTWNVQSNTATTGVDAVIASMGTTGVDAVIASMGNGATFRLYAMFPSTPTDDYLWYYGKVLVKR